MPFGFDPNILLQAQGVQIPDPVKMYGQALTLGDLARHNRMAEADEAQKISDRAALEGSRQVLADAQTMGWQPAFQKWAQINPAAVAVALKLRRDDEATQADIDLKRAQADDYRAKGNKDTIEARANGIKVLGNMAAGIASKGGPVTRADAWLLLAQAKHLGTPDDIINAAPDDPDAFKQYAANLAAAASDPEKQAQIWKIRQLTPAEVREKNAQAGNLESQTEWRPYSEGSQRMTAGAAVSNAATNANRLDLERRNQNKPLLQTGQNGEIFSVDPRTATGRVVTGPDGQPLSKGDKALTESQGTATAFGMRMRDASKTIRELEATGVVDPSGMLVAASGNSGYAGPALNAAAGAVNPYAQVYKQAQKNWVTANLRKESGAAIPVEEMEADIQKWFPVPGDRPEVIRAKAAARDVAERAMIVQAGPGSKNIPAASGGRATSGEIGGRTMTAAKMPNPAGLPDGTEVTDNATGEVYVVNGDRYGMPRRP